MAKVTSGSTPPVGQASSTDSKKTIWGTPQERLLLILRKMNESSSDRTKLAEALILTFKDHEELFNAFVTGYLGHENHSQMLNVRKHEDRGPTFDEKVDFLVNKYGVNLTTAMAAWLQFVFPEEHGFKNWPSPGKESFKRGRLLQQLYKESIATFGQNPQEFFKAVEEVAPRGVSILHTPLYISILDVVEHLSANGRLEEVRSDLITMGKLKIEAPAPLASVSSSGNPRGEYGTPARVTQPGLGSSVLGRAPASSQTPKPSTSISHTQIASLIQLLDSGLNAHQTQWSDFLTAVRPAYERGLSRAGEHIPRQFENQYLRPQNVQKFVFECVVTGHVTPEDLLSALRKVAEPYQQNLINQAEAIFSVPATETTPHATPLSKEEREFLEFHLNAMEGRDRMAVLDALNLPRRYWFEPQELLEMIAKERSDLTYELLAKAILVQQATLIPPTQFSKILKGMKVTDRNALDSSVNPQDRIEIALKHVKIGDLLNALHTARADLQTDTPSSPPVSRKRANRGSPPPSRTPVQLEHLEKIVQNTPLLEVLRAMQRHTPGLYRKFSYPFRAAIGINGNDHSTSADPEKLAQLPGATYERILLYLSGNDSYDPKDGRGGLSSQDKENVLKLLRDLTEQTPSPSSRSHHDHAYTPSSKTPLGRMGDAAAESAGRDNSRSLRGEHDTTGPKREERDRERSTPPRTPKRH